MSNHSLKMRICFALSSMLSFSERISAAGDCSLEIVQQATFNGFLKFSLLNCEAGDSVTHLTIIGTLPLSYQTCLDAFNLVNHGPYPIPDRGACHVDYLDLLAVINQISLKEAGFAYDQTSGVLSLNYEGFDATAGAFSNFMSRAGHPVVLNACDPNYVRRQSVSGFYYDAVSGILGDPTRDYNVNSVEAAGFVGGQFQPLDTALCVGCYQGFLDFIQAGTRDSSSNQFSFINFPSVLLAQCVRDPDGAECTTSPQMDRARSNFAQCAGGNLQVDFVGPLCGESVSRKILQGRYFERAVVCTINDHPNVPDCVNWDSDYRRLPGDLLSDCVACITDLVSDILSILEQSRADNLGLFCGSIESVSSSACLQRLGTVPRAFSDCIGVSIDHLSMTSNMDNDQFNGAGDVYGYSETRGDAPSLVFIRFSFIVVLLHMIVT